MNLKDGFQIEEPAVFIPWGISEDQLVDLLPVAPRHVASGYHVIDCKSLSGLHHALGFHFRPPADGKLRELEFFRRAYPDMQESFLDFQAHLEATFGTPTSQSPGDLGLPHYYWTIDGTWIRHYVFERFGPEEHVRIGRS